MNIKYKCKCMGSETTISVPGRRPNTDILGWMEMVQQCIGYDHRSLSPLCQSREMEYAMIPHDEAAEGIGIPPTKQ